MVRPQSRSYNTPLPEYQPLLWRIEKPINEVKDPSDPDRTSVVIPFTVLSEPFGSMDPPHKERQRHGNTVNPKGDGTPSLLAQLINAASPADMTKAEMLDLDIDEFLPGKVVEVIGHVKESDRGRFFNVDKYRRPTGATAAVAAAQPAATPAPAADEYRYTEDGKFRWKAGMAAWEPVPAAPPAPPAPPPAPPSPPPAPPAAPPPVPAATEPAKPAVRF